MRVTKQKLTDEERRALGDIDIKLTDLNNARITTNLVHDLYALLATENVSRKELRNNIQIFQGVRRLYEGHRMSRLIPSVRFYRKIRDTLDELSRSEAFNLLKEMMDPLEATRYLLEMIQPEQSQGGQNDNTEQGQSQNQQQKESGQSNDTEQEESDQKQGDKEEGEQQKDTSKKQQSQSQGNTENDQSYDTETENSSQPGGDADKKTSEVPPDPIDDSTPDPIDHMKMMDNLQALKTLANTGVFDEGFHGDMAREKVYGAKRAGTGSNLQYLRTVLENMDEVKDRIRQGDSFQNVLTVARNLEMVDLYDLGDELSNSLVPQNEMTIGVMQNNMDVLKSLPTEFLYDDDILAAKIAKKEVQIRQYQHRQARKQALYVLVDASGSMRGTDELYAQAVVLAMLDHAIEGNAKYFFRFFDDEVAGLESATTEEEAQVLLKRLRDGWVGGGGTDISNAISVAVDDIRNDPNKFEKMSILCITDACDTPKIKREDLHGIELHMIMLGSGTSSWKALCTHHTVVDRMELQDMFRDSTSGLPL